MSSEKGRTFTHLQWKDRLIAIIKKTNNRQSWQTNGGNREEKRK